VAVSGGVTPASNRIREGEAGLMKIKRFYGIYSSWFCCAIARLLLAPSPSGCGGGCGAIPGDAPYSYSGNLVKAQQNPILNCPQKRRLFISPGRGSRRAEYRSKSAGRSRCPEIRKRYTSEYGGADVPVCPEFASGGIPAPKVDSAIATRSSPSTLTGPHAKQARLALSAIELDVLGVSRIAGGANRTSSDSGGTQRARQ
jgi:hypothetical protein